MPVNDIIWRTAEQMHQKASDRMQAAICERITSPFILSPKMGQIGVKQFWAYKKALKSQGFQGFAVAGAEELKPSTKVLETESWLSE